MSASRSWLRLAAVAVALVGILGGAYAAGRSTVPRPGAPDPVRLEQGIAVGVLESPAGALAAADNYAATGLTASIDPGQLRTFADTVIEPAARGAFLSAGQSLVQSGAPAGGEVLGLVVAHRLVSYGEGAAEVMEWALASDWGTVGRPAQYSAFIDLRVRWNGDTWQVASVRDSVPGPVPGLIGGEAEARSSAVWDQTLSGMSAPYYGDAG
jgi:hypothetical protein